MAKIVQMKQQAQALPDIAERWGGSDMTVIMVAAPAAGSGKTTLAAHLAVHAARACAEPVAMLDCAPDQALMRWDAKRGNPTPAVQATSRNKLREDIAALAHEGNHAVCIVDMMACDAPAIHHALLATHLVAIPCALEEEALTAAGHFAGQIRKIGIPAGIVVTGASPGDEFWIPQTRRLWADGLLVAGVMHRDNNIPAATLEGRTVIESDEDGLVAEDMGRIWRNLRELRTRERLPRPGQSHRRNLRRTEW